VFGRLAGYEDVNDAERLRRDPAMRWVVGEAANPTIWPPAPSDAIESRCGAPQWNGKLPSNAQESGECRISLVAAELREERMTRKTGSVSVVAGVLCCAAALLPLATPVPARADNIVIGTGQTGPAGSPGTFPCGNGGAGGDGSGALADAISSQLVNEGFGTAGSGGDGGNGAAAKPPACSQGGSGGNGGTGGTESVTAQTTAAGGNTTTSATATAGSGGTAGVGGQGNPNGSDGSGGAGGKATANSVVNNSTAGSNALTVLSLIHI